MQSLGTFNSEAECRRVRDLLESHGIPTDFAAGSFAGRSTLFVCINEQFDDALALINDPEHLVAQPVDVPAFRRATQTQSLRPLFIGGVAILVVLLAVFGVLMAVHHYG